jgi:hypothetical protein
LVLLTVITHVVLMIARAFLEMFFFLYDQVQFHGPQRTSRLWHYLLLKSSYLAGNDAKSSWYSSARFTLILDIVFGGIYVKMVRLSWSFVRVKTKLLISWQNLPKNPCSRSLEAWLEFVHHITLFKKEYFNFNGSKWWIVRIWPFH